MVKIRIWTFKDLFRSSVRRLSLAIILRLLSPSGQSGHVIFQQKKIAGKDHAMSFPHGSAYNFEVSTWKFQRFYQDLVSSYPHRLRFCQVCPNMHHTQMIFLRRLMFDHSQLENFPRGSDQFLQQQKRVDSQHQGVDSQHHGWILNTMGWVDSQHHGLDSRHKGVDSRHQGVDSQHQGVDF